LIFKAGVDSWVKRIDRTCKNEIGKYEEGQINQKSSSIKVKLKSFILN
jgi:hypothetical protein